jgi:hypothetical protein
MVAGPLDFLCLSSHLRIDSARLRAIRRIGAALGIMHQAVIAAKMRRVERELMFHDGTYDRWFSEPDTQQNHASGKDLANFPQRPLLLSDKWDF